MPTKRCLSASSGRVYHSTLQPSPPSQIISQPPLRSTTAHLSSGCEMTTSPPCHHHINHHHHHYHPNHPTVLCSASPGPGDPCILHSPIPALHPPCGPITSPPVHLPTHSPAAAISQLLPAHPRRVHSQGGPLTWPSGLYAAPRLPAPPSFREGPAWLHPPDSACLLHPGCVPLAPGLSPNVIATAPLPGKVFDHFDLDGTGVVSKSELMQLGTARAALGWG